MRAQRVLLALGTLTTMALASWLPAGAAAPAGAAVPDLARASLPPPATIPAHPANPVQAVSVFFWQLSLGLGGDQPAATAPSRRPGETGAPAADAAPAAFARAYQLLAPAWAANLPFARFTAAWSQLRRLDLLAAIGAGSPAGSPNEARVFVEVRTLTAAGRTCPQSCLGFADGFYVVAPGREGWRLVRGALEAEDMAGKPQTAAASALAAARAYAVQRPQPPAPGTAGHVTLGAEQDHRLRAEVTLGDHHYEVQLFQLVDGDWVPLTVQP